MIPKLVKDKKASFAGCKEDSYLDQDGLNWLLYDENSPVNKIRYDINGDHVYFIISCNDHSCGSFFTDRNLWEGQIRQNKVDWIKEGF